jgi:hypothetical protein
LFPVIYDGEKAGFFELSPVFRELCPERAGQQGFGRVPWISPPSESYGSEKSPALRVQKGILDQIPGSRPSGKRGFLPLSEGPSKMTDPELLRKTIVFLFQDTAAWPGSRQPAGLLVIVSRESRLKTGRTWPLIPGFSRIIPGNGDREGFREGALIKATVGEPRGYQQVSLSGIDDLPGSLLECR